MATKGNANTVYQANVVIGADVTAVPPAVEAAKAEVASIGPAADAAAAQVKAASASMAASLGGVAAAGARAGAAAAGAGGIGAGAGGPAAASPVDPFSRPQLMGVALLVSQIRRIMGLILWPVTITYGVMRTLNALNEARIAAINFDKEILQIGIDSHKELGKIGSYLEKPGQEFEKQRRQIKEHVGEDLNRITEIAEKQAATQEMFAASAGRIMQTVTFNRIDKDAAENWGGMLWRTFTGSRSPEEIRARAKREQIRMQADLKRQLEEFDRTVIEPRRQTIHREFRLEQAGTTNQDVGRIAVNINRLMQVLDLRAAGYRR